MANYFVIGNNFKPFTYEEMVKPLVDYSNAYRQQEALLDAAREKEFTGNLSPSDGAAYNLYINANNALKGVSDELATKGLSDNLRGRLRDAAKDYKRDMDNLNDAQTRLQAEMDRRAKAGPGYVYQGTPTINDYLNGATPTYKSKSLDQITKDVGTQFAARAKEISRDTWDKVLDQNGNVINGYYDVATTTGLTGAQLNSILDDDQWRRSVLENPKITKEERETLQGFRDIIAREKANMDYDNYDPSSQGEIRNAIALGTAAGLGTTEHKYQKDLDFVDWATRQQIAMGWSDRKDPMDEFGELPYTHTDEKNPTKANRNGFKEGWAVKAGKLQYGIGAGGTDYINKTPGITVYTPTTKGDVTTTTSRTYDNWGQVNSAYTKASGNASKVPSLKTRDIMYIVATPAKDKKGNDDEAKTKIREKIVDDIRREALNRIGATFEDTHDGIGIAVNNNLSLLKQLDIKVATNDDGDILQYSIGDKSTQRETEERTPATPTNGNIYQLRQ